MNLFSLQITKIQRHVAGVVIACMCAQVLLPAVQFAYAEETVVEDTPEEVVVTTLEEQTQTSESSIEETTDLEEEHDDEESEDVEETTEEDEDSAEEPVSIPEGDASVVTGDATAALDLENTTNTNVTDTLSSTSTATSTSTTTKPFTFANTDTVTASNTNDSNASTTAVVVADTGENTALGDTATVVTGDAIALANVVNLANTNIVNSKGFIEFFASLGFNTIDLREIFGVFDTAQSTAPCISGVCGREDVNYNVSNTNSATITNDITVIADTGGNTATGGDTAFIGTGNAYAAANVLNIANTNITDSNYLLLSFNNLGSMDGDIVLPNAATFLELFGQGGVSGASVTNTNAADVENNVSVIADTGGNTVEGENGAIITGDAHSSGNVSNTTNQNFFGADSFVMLIRVHGNWSGDLFGLPEGMEWRETAQGIELMFNQGNSAGQDSTYTVTNENNANIKNNVTVMALTGENKASGEESGVGTGDAYAAASVTNIVNTNVLGQNWALLIFDIFGDWNGNIAFGRPDLWIGAKAQGNSTLMPGSSVAYTMTVTNFGDTPAHNVTIDNAFGSKVLRIKDEEAHDIGGGRAMVSLPVGTLAPGETKEVHFEGTIGDVPRDRETAIELNAFVHATENEDDLSDNHESITVVAGEKRDDEDRPSRKFPANIEITKTASVDETTVPAAVSYLITIENHGGPVFDAMIADTLTDEEGNVYSEDRFELGTIANDEVIEIEYTLDFGENMNPGIYTNYAQLFGTHRSTNKKYEELYLTEEVAESIRIVGDGPVGEVLGLSTTVCPAYLDGYLGQGYDNDPDEVLKLQQFLAEHQGQEVPLTGRFDAVTNRAVQAFQKKYQYDVLMPWGMSDPSGYVYLTTRKKINEIMCQGTRHFPLTKNQEAEVTRYKKLSMTIPLEETPPVADTLAIEDTPAVVTHGRPEALYDTGSDTPYLPSRRSESGSLWTSWTKKLIKPQFLDWIWNQVSAVLGNLVLR